LPLNITPLMTSIQPPLPAYSMRGF
jgi:hypothetical protein